jgi:ribonuclease III
LGYKFRRPELLERALTHTSHAHEEGSRNGQELRHNERLEFLGDAVLELAATEALFDRFSDFAEGELSKLRAHLVSQKHLTRVADELQLGRYLRLGRGEERSGGRHKAALLCDALEAVIGAIYLDSGLEAPRRLIEERIVNPELERVEHERDLPITDYKSALQETAHVMGRGQPRYEVISEEGPQHRKLFTIEARIHRAGPRSKVEFAAAATGSTKKAAEQNAARQALDYLRSMQAAGDDKKDDTKSDKKAAAAPKDAKSSPARLRRPRTTRAMLQD